MTKRSQELNMEYFNILQQKNETLTQKIEDLKSKV